MFKFTFAGLTALVVFTSPIAHAQTPSSTALNPAAVNALTDARLSAVKSALQLTPEQQKYWPAVEDAVRARANDRETRIASVADRLDAVQSRGPAETLQNFDPIDLMNRRADALAQRADNLKKVAGAWKPLYQSLNPEQKLRMAFLTISALHEFRNALDQPSTHFEVYDDETW